MSTHQPYADAHIHIFIHAFANIPARVSEFWKYTFVLRVLSKSLVCPRVFLDMKYV